MNVLRMPAISKWLYPGAVTLQETGQPLLYLSFDDGPDIHSTSAIMDILGRYKIRAIFFCTGDRAEKHPELMAGLMAEGHLTGNHTYSHRDGFKTSVKKYVEDVQRAATLTSGTLFRPPYGRMRPGQFRILSGSYKIFLWDLMAADYSGRTLGEKIKAELLEKIRPGSVIALHDRPVSVEKGFLEGFIESCLRKGYSFALPVFNL